MRALSVYVALYTGSSPIAGLASRCHVIQVKSDNGKLLYYEVGDVVHILDEASVKGQCKKWCPPWRGPGIIIKKFSSYLFRVKLRNAIMVLNHDMIKRCRDRSLPAWLRQQKEKPVVDDEVLASGKEYCLCKKPWGGRFMIQCDYCDEWYHGSCINITPSEALDINKYQCGDCQRRLRL